MEKKKKKKKIMKKLNTTTDRTLSVNHETLTDLEKCDLQITVLEWDREKDRSREY